jgi:DNA invertase Pin-like site-specific DNA recombinase
MRGDSFEPQTKKAAEYASAHGLELDTTLTFRDLGVSAFRGRNAQTRALRAFLDGVEHGDIPQGSHLLVESLDRISREQIIAAQGLFLQIIDAGVTLVTLRTIRRIQRRTSTPTPPT